MPLSAHIHLCGQALWHYWGSDYISGCTLAYSFSAEWNVLIWCDTMTRPLTAFIIRAVKPRQAAAVSAFCYRSFSFSSPANLEPTVQVIAQAFFNGRVISPLALKRVASTNPNNSCECLTWRQVLLKGAVDGGCRKVLWAQRIAGWKGLGANKIVVQVQQSRVQQKVL